MLEGTLVQKLVEELARVMPGAVIFKHADRITSGIPDLSITWHGRTTWLEVKHVNPRLKSKGIQNLTALKLAGAGNCWYVLYEETETQKRTRIVAPLCIHNDEWMTSGVTSVGFDHHFVADFVRRHHP